MKKIMFASLALVLIFSSCKKKGCVDSDATNYDSKAKKDDGSCTYPVEVIELITIESSPRYSFEIDGVLSDVTSQSIVSQGFSSSGISLGSFFYNYLTDFTPIAIEREGLTYVGMSMTDSELESYFTVGTYHYSNMSNNYSGFDVMVEGATGVFYHSKLGSQTGSSFSIISAQNEMINGWFNMKVYMEFNCKVYNADDLSDVKTITNGQLVTYFKDV